MPAHAADPTVDAPRPDAAAARRLASDLLDRLRDDRLDDDWLARHLQPAHLAVAPTQAWRTAWLDALGPDRPLGAALRTGAPVAVLAGPTYQRVLLGPAPGPSLIVRELDGRPVIDGLDWTTCTLCDERERFVRDLLDEVRRRGLRAHRLLPGVDLSLDAVLARTGRGEDWVATLELRNRTGGHLATTLRGARVLGADGEVVRVRYADGAVDTWRVIQDEGRWQLDYDGLSPDSPLRLAPWRAGTWRSRGRLQQGARAAWTPSFRALADGAGVELGTGALDAWPDPRDGRVWVVVSDLDRVLAGAFRVDPDSRRVIDRLPLPTADPRTQLPLEDWPTAWRASLAPDVHRLALTGPDRIWTVDLVTRQSALIARGEATWLGWAGEGPGPATLLVGTPTSLWRYDGRTAVARHRLGAPVRAAWSAGTDGLALTADGQVVDLADGTSTDRVCCGAVVDAAARPDGGALLASCAAPCDSVATLWRPGEDPVDLPGAGTDAAGASFSPDGTWFTTGRDEAAGAVLLWSARDLRPVARIPVGPVQAVRWSADGAHLLTVEQGGTVGWWSVPALLADHALVDPPPAVSPQP